MYHANQHEHDVLNFWEKDKTFEKSVTERPEDQPYVFYDGPPFATGLPHYGHIVASTMKDAVPRYQTMKGKRVVRRWGWDCHGLPIENLVEKELELPGRKEIVDYGIDRFNEACRSKVMMYADEWQKVIHRFGRWVDMDNGYKTMDVSFMESVWWVFKSLFDKGLIYEGRKAMHVCPHCATPLSNFEVSQGYKDVKDLSVTAKFKVQDASAVLPDALGDVFILAWTTTPWTLPGNILLAVGNDVQYSYVSFEGNTYVVAKELLLSVFGQDKAFDVIGHVTGSELVGLTYEPLFPYFKHEEGIENGYRVVTADFVTTEDGTGIVHIAPAFGDDDYAVFKQEDVPFIQHVTIEGEFIDAVTDFAGMKVKTAQDNMSADIAVIKYLAVHDTLFSKEKYTHSYPHCWRCDTPLLNYATSSWFVEVTKLREQLIENNTSINWIPEHIKEGRFGKWLEGVKDWSISRNRFWGTPLPIWRSEDGDIICIGSKTELEELTGTAVDDLHKHHIDRLTIEKDGKTYTRVEEVLDTWFDSGSVPYGQQHYPFENNEVLEQGFPAEFIAEGQDQTRGWFYTLHVLATALTHGESAIATKQDQPAFRNVIVNGIVLAEDGKKMSKRLKNYPDPMEMIEKYGSDAIRFYLLSSPVMHAENLNFSEQGLREVYNKVLNTLWNVVEFYRLYQDETVDVTSLPESDDVLDQWILARLRQTAVEVTTNMDAYKLTEASRPLLDFVQELSQWYVRRSRDRFKFEGEERTQATKTLGYVLVELSKVMAPFTPFIAETVWQLVSGKQTSVHLEAWPTHKAQPEDDAQMAKMAQVRKVVEKAMSLRKKSGVKVRQPLQSITVNDPDVVVFGKQLLCDELNIKDVLLDESMVDDQGDTLAVMLDTTMTSELEQEGLLRELIRSVNIMRKESGLTPEDKVTIIYRSEHDMVNAVFASYEEELLQQTASVGVEVGNGEPLTLNGCELELAIKV